MQHIQQQFAHLVLGDQRQQFARTKQAQDFGRFVLIALGGIVPFLSFFTERRFSRLAKGETN